MRQAFDDEEDGAGVKRELGMTTSYTGPSWKPCAPPYRHSHTRPIPPSLPKMLRRPYCMHTQACVCIAGRPKQMTRREATALSAKAQDSDLSVLLVAALQVGKPPCRKDNTEV